ncbi:MAG: hypothetical protein Q7V48_00220 [Deltaproteobacteria bacterium]|nr:hypothetical protein [Deltaproteobacteria bacterium]
MGYILQQTLMNELKSYNLNFNVVTMITQVLVDRHDPDFQHPSKPVGPFYDPATKEKLESEKGWRMKKVLPGGDTPFRRVVPSPDPIRILEVHALKKVVEAGMIVIASGGGGVPVILNEKGEFEGFEGAVDKDLAGEKLAEAVAADYFMVLTDVPKVKLGFGTPEEREIDRLNVEEARKYLNSRTIRSLTYVVAKYSGIKIYFVSPRVLKMKDDMKDYLREHQVPCSETLDSAVDWREIASKADILYITQIPREQFGDQVDDYERSKEIFRVNPDILKALRKDTYIMHPFPRDHELPMEIDQDPRAVYFDLIKYGQFLRMGLLCHVLRVPVG